MTWDAPQATLLPDRKRLHLHHGPIDLIIGVSKDAREACFKLATHRFQSILTGLVAELDALRHPTTSETTFKGAVARRMAAAVRPHADVFVTPMAAVAGAVADEVLVAMLAGQKPQKAYVNNGGDIAFHLSTGETLDTLSPAGQMTVTAQQKSRGVATSGWQGRSHSLGIAEAVTVIAETAAAADVAATLIANAVDLPGHQAIQRTPASRLSPDSDLGNRAVTTHVGQLANDEIARALKAGVARAKQLSAQGLIHAAAICLQGQSKIIEYPHQTNAIGEPAHARIQHPQNATHC